MQHQLKSLIPILFLVPLLFALDAVAQEHGKGHGKGAVHVRGTLTGEGVECQALRGSDGKLYTLSGDLGGFKAGDKVRVQGQVAEISTCQQGTTITVAKIQEDKSQGNDQIKVTGVLTDEGAECPALRGDDGQLYTLTPRDLQGFEVGDRVTVTGTVAERNFCQQGTTIEVRKIKAAK
ncbi:MAG TPA: DUF5818 domain-containing protein [Thermoanaerobaculia bacterium]|nr:DUF5818 domain-containing protein [Thermoanaerobaculia bacterium]